MVRGVKKKAAKEFVEKIREIDPERKFMCSHENWKEKLLEIEIECKSDAETLMTCQYENWLNEILGGSYGKQMHDMVQESIDRADNPFEAFRSVVEMGVTPPPTLIYIIDELYKTYKLSFGHYTWEEVCFGKPIKGVGTYAARAYFSKNKREEGFHGWVKKHRKKGDTRSLPILAEAFFENSREMAKKFPDLAKMDNHNQESEASENIDIDSFLRKYRRWKEANADT